jgi:hypothetical protein
VIGVDAQRGIDARVVAVGHFEQLAGAVDDGQQQIGVVVRKLPL